METRLYPWIEALRRSLDELGASVEPLSIEDLRRASYDPGWSVADVLSHLGSQAEYFGLLFDAGVSGGAAPGDEVLPPIWEAWGAKDPERRRDESLAANEALLGRFEALDAAGREQFHLSAFGLELDAAGLARLRLGELALHTWDVAVVFDPEATVVPDAVDLLVDALDQLVAWTGRPGTTPLRARISTSDPERRFGLVVGDAVTLGPPEHDPELAELRLPAEAFLRLVYGRLDPDHTPPLHAAGIELDVVRAVFPGL